MTPRTSPEDRALAIELLQALAKAADADALHAARMAFFESPLPLFTDPIGVPCPADDPDAGYGLTLGCPTTTDWASRVRTHADGHAPFRLTARMAHCDRLARAAWKSGAT